MAVFIPAENASKQEKRPALSIKQAVFYPKHSAPCGFRLNISPVCLKIYANRLTFDVDRLIYVVGSLNFFLE